MVFCPLISMHSAKETNFYDLIQPAFPASHSRFFFFKKKIDDFDLEVGN